MVHLIYKTQVLMKAEDREGTDSTPGASNALLAIDPTSTPSRTSNERRVASVSLSRERATRGRQTHPVTFGLDLRGRGTSTRPEFALPMRCCGMRELAVTQLTVDSTVGFSVGDIITEAKTDAAGNVPSGVIVEVTSGTVFKVGVRGQAAFTATGTDEQLTITNTLSGGTGEALVTAVASVANQYVYVPDSQRALYVPLASTVVFATSGDAQGEGVAQTSSTPTWAGLVRRYDYTSATKALYLDIAYGQPANGDTFTTSGGTGTVSGTPTWVTGWVPTASIYINTDNYRKKCTGARGNYVIRGQVGETGRIDFTFNGKIGTLGDATFASSPTFQSDASPLRIMGTAFTFNGVQVPTGSLELDFGANVVMRPDMGDATGDISAMITERSPVFRMDPEWQPAVGIDIHGLFNAQTLFPVHMQFGDASGNIIVIHAPKCEITAVGNGNREGIWTGELEVRPRRVTGNGDDEFFIYAH